MDASHGAEVEPEHTKRAKRRFRTLEEKLAILKEAASPGASLAAVARKHGMNSNLLFGWRRLQQRGLLDTQRHGRVPALLPVKITTPTLTPTERAGISEPTRRHQALRSANLSESCLELLLPGELRVRIYGEAQRAIVNQVLELFPKR
jgi:transposase-like protein